MCRGNAIPLLILQLTVLYNAHQNFRDFFVDMKEGAASCDMLVMEDKWDGYIFKDD